jgi:hypothetical protein
MPIAAFAVFTVNRCVRCRAMPALSSNTGALRPPLVAARRPADRATSERGRQAAGGAKRVALPAMSRLVRFVVAVAVLAVLGACASASAAAQQPGVLGPAAGGGGVVAKPAIVNGTELQIASVPWQIHLLMRGADGRVFQCGGSILAPTVVATAAHCLFDPATGAHFAVARMTVQAGVSHTATPEPGDVRQSVGVAGVVSHPYYVYDAARGGVAPDDVALLTLAAPLNLGGATARAIGLYAGGPLVAAGTAAYISGYGRQARGVTPNGNLYGVDTVVIDPPQCGAEATALVLCIQSPAGSACEGDSGGPLTVGGLLAGIASFIALNGPTGDCGIGSFNGYANVAAPEIAEFLRGNPAPPRAPRGGVDVGGRGVFQVGGTLTCNPGTWSEAPAFSYAFYDTRDGTLLQQGPAGTYTFAAGDVGRTVACAVTAANV